MKSKFLAAAASIAFIASGVVAHAQDQQKHEERPAAERTAPNAGATHEQAAPRAAQAEPRRDEMKGANPAARAEGERNNEMKAGQGAERPRAAEAPGQERKAEEQRKAEEPRKAEEQRKAEEPRKAEEQRPAAEGKRMAEPNGEKAPAARTGANEQDRNAPRTAERKDAHGQARVEGNVKMSTEHATRVSQSLLREGHREHSDIRVRVGERVPEGVRFLPLPEDVVAIVPEYRGYDYFIDDNDEIVFVSPESHEIVGMIDYEGRAASDENYTSVSASRPCPTEQ